MPRTLPRLLTLLGAALVGALLLTGITTPAQAENGASGATPPGKAWIRAGHFVPGLGAVTIQLAPASGSIIDLTPQLSYGDVTDYTKVAPGDYTVLIRPEGTPESSDPMLSRSLTVTSGKAGTVALLGTTEQPRLAVLKDDLTPPAAGTARVRVLSGSSLAQPVSVAAVDGPTIATDVVLGQTTDYTAVPQGSWTLDLSSGSGMTTEQTVGIAPGSVYTIVALDKGTKDVKLEVVTDAAGAMAMPKGGADTGAGGTATTAYAGSSFPGLPLAGGALALLLLAAVTVRRLAPVR